LIIFSFLFFFLLKIENKPREYLKGFMTKAIKLNEKLNKDWLIVDIKKKSEESIELENADADLNLSELESINESIEEEKLMNDFEEDVPSNERLPIIRNKLIKDKSKTEIELKNKELENEEIFFSHVYENDVASIEMKQDSKLTVENNDLPFMQLLEPSTICNIS